MKPWSIHGVIRRWVTGATGAAAWILALALLGVTGRGAVDIRPLQQQLNAGQTNEVLRVFEQALELDPDNLHLRYNRAVAAYAAGRFEEALLDLDLVEGGDNPALAAKASFQKGNAEYRLGLESRSRDVELTVTRWKQSVASYEGLLKQQPAHAGASTNHAVVRKQLFELLMKLAEENMQRGSPTNQPAAERIQPLRNAMEKFSEASTLQPSHAPAKEGEKQAREQLAAALAEEGTRKTLSNQMVMPAANQPPLRRPDVGQIQEGVNMLEDAHALQPGDAGIERQLNEGKERLANALALQAMIYASVEPGIKRIDDKLGVLRMGMEFAEKALDLSPKHGMAQQVLEQIKKRLAEIHEQQGDQLSQQADSSELEQQAQQLSQALDHYQQASSLQPQQGQLPGKASQAQKRLESALEKLGDKLMKKPGKQESLEQEITRLEGAEQAFNELQGLNPSDQTAEKARQVGKQLGGLRQKLAESGQPQKGEQGQSPNPNGEGEHEDPLGSMPMDAPPKLDTPGVRGRYQSPAMNRNLRDY